MIVIPAKDIDEMKNFYEKAFGWKFKEGILNSEFYEGRIVYVTIPGSKINHKLGFDGFIMKKKFFGQVPVEYYESKDIDSSIDLVKDMGGSIYFNKTIIDVNKLLVAIVVILDSNGSPFGLYQIVGKSNKK